ncbi:hypothetical protein HOY80DRAFT_1023149 [Tuber brumale]|nr:hypothetical protein HOY80DRAFT_1023149 [Tuber brumale]
MEAYLEILCCGLTIPTDPPRERYHWWISPITTMSPSSSPRPDTPPNPLLLDVSEIELEISLLKKLVKFLKSKKEEHDTAAEVCARAFDNAKVLSQLVGDDMERCQRLILRNRERIWEIRRRVPFLPRSPYNRLYPNELPQPYHGQISIMGATYSSPLVRPRLSATSTVSQHSTTNVDITHTNPSISLPLDLLTYLQSITTSPTCYIRSLKNFDSLSSTLVFHIRLLPPSVSIGEKAKAETEEFDERWIEQATAWSSEILHILGEMQRCLATLLETKPDDLKGNYHSLEEWEEEVVDAAKALEGVAARFKTEMKGKGKGPRSGIPVMKALEEAKGIRMLNLK